MIWEILFSSFLVAIAYKFIRLLSDRQPLKDKNISLPGHLRELGLLEYVYQILFQRQHFLMSYNIVIKSKVSMDNRKVEEALEILAKRHPLLQAALTEVNHADGKRFHFSKMPSFRVDYQQSDKVATEQGQLHHVITKDLFEPISVQNGPLWRCSRLKEYIDAESSEVTNCFVFTLHHAIIDGISKTMLFEEFLSILDKLHKNERIPEISYDLRPSLETILADKIRPEWWRKVAAKVVETLFKIGLFSLKSKKIDVYFNKYPVIRNVYPDVKEEIGTIFTSFSNLETKKLLHVCKEHGCTVNGAVTAAANMAMADILQDGEVAEAQWIPSNYAISCRRHFDLHEDKNTDYLGLYFSFLNVECYVPPYNSQSFSHVFWKTARDITVDVRQKVKAEAHLETCKSLQTFSLPFFVSAFESSVWEHHGGRYGDKLFFISNSGRFDKTSDIDSLFNIEELFVANSSHQRGHLFEIYFITINGRFCSSLVYFPHVTARSQAEDFNSKLLQNLRLTFNDN